MLGRRSASIPHFYSNSNQATTNAIGNAASLWKHKNIVLCASKIPPFLVVPELLPFGFLRLQLLPHFLGELHTAEGLLPPAPPLLDP